MKKQRRFLCLSGGGYNNGWQISADGIFGAEWEHSGGVTGKKKRKIKFLQYLFQVKKNILVGES